jgi:hypothetical protein
MPSPGSLSAVVLIVIGLAGIWPPTAGRLASHSDPIPAVAALAWAQANCDPTLSLRRGTPRIQAEDLFGVAAKFDADSKQRGLTFACQRAKAQSMSVTAKPQNTNAATLLRVLASLH